MATKAALLVTSSVEVSCPHCGEAQPSPANGSHIWLPEEVREHQGLKTCVSCDQPFRLMTQINAKIV